MQGDVTHFYLGTGILYFHRKLANGHEGEECFLIISVSLCLSYF